PPQLLRVERHRRQILRGAHHLHRHRTLQLDMGPGSQAVFLAPLLLAPARPELRQPRRPARNAQGHALLVGHGPRRFPVRRCTPSSWPSAGRSSAPSLTSSASFRRYRRVASGASSCATTTSLPWRWSRTKSAITCTVNTPTTRA